MRWKDFVHFMDAIGFTVAKQTLGSGYIFQPLGGVTVTDVRVRIGFYIGHRLDVVAGEWERYQYIDAGKKLTKELGITGEMFYLKR